MPPFVISRAIFLAIIAATVIIDLFFYPVHWLVYLLVVFTFVIIIAMGSSSMGLQFFMKAYTSIDTKEKIIALTFDDGPHPEFTPAILDLLDKYNAKATFFCIGKNVEMHQQLARTIKDKGHVLGNHSYSHNNLFSLFGKKKVENELTSSNDVILATTGAHCKLFRPPYGVTNPPIASALKSLPLKTVGWSIRSFDTSRAPEKVIKSVISKIKPGSIILLHDNRMQTIQILEAILLYTKQHHYQCVPISDKLILK